MITEYVGRLNDLQDQTGEADKMNMGPFIARDLIDRGE